MDSVEEGTLNLTSDPNLKQLVQQAIVAFNEGDLEKYFRLHTSATTVAEAGDLTYRAASEYRRRLLAFRERYPEARVAIERLVAEPPIVVMESRFTLHGSDTEIPTREAVVFDFEFDKIARTTVYSTSRFVFHEDSEKGA